MRRAFLLQICAGIAAFPQLRRQKSAPEPEQDQLLGKLSGNHKFIGGLVWARDGFLLFSDTPSGKIVKINEQGTSIFREGLAGPQGLAVDDDGRLYVCESRARRVIRIDKKGKLEVLADKWDGKLLNSPNDIAVSKNDHVYFTDPAFAFADQNRELPFYGVYHLTPKGEMSLIAKPAGRPNGIALSGDNKILYVVDSDSRSVLTFDVAKNGSVSNERTLIAGIVGVPDGIRADPSGLIYVAASQVEVFSPGGKKVREIPIGEKPSACAFGESDQQTLFIAARTSVYRARLRAEAQH